VAAAEGDYAAARPRHEEAIEIAREIGDHLALSQGLNDLAELLRAQGEIDAAVPLYEEALALARSLGDTDGIVTFLLNLSSIEIGRGETAGTGSRLAEALRLAGEVGSSQQFGLEMASALAAPRGEGARAARLNGAAEALLERQGAQRAPVDEHFLAAWMARARSQIGDRAFVAAYEEGRSLGDEQALAEVREWLEGEAKAARAGA